MSDRVERRRTPRITVGADDAVRLELRHRVQLLDISKSGALLSCEVPLPLGTRGHFRAGLAGLPFGVELEVRRHQPRPTTRNVGLGAKFGIPDERSTRHLDLFLQKAKSGGN